jgi:hypothetical protein
MHTQAPSALQQLEGLRFPEMLALAMQSGASIHDAVDLVAPLVSRHLRVNWAQLVNGGVDAGDVIRMATLAADALAALAHWDRSSVQHILDDATETEGSGASALRALGICILFEPSPLPLADAIVLLGAEESVRRLRWVAANLPLLQMVG